MQSRVGRSANSASSLSAGAMSEEQFRAAFESVPNIKLESLRDLIAECQNQAAILENVNNDWTKRTKALQTLRALIKKDIGCYAAFTEQVYSLLGNALELSVKDLRSTLCREACITIAYYSEKLGIGFWRICESILPITMNLTQNSAKIMATSGQICNIYIAKYVHHPKVLSIIVQQSAHKAKEIRRMSIALVAIIVNSWDPNMVERHSAELLQTIKLAISDADPEARATARQAFENLQNNYPHKAEALFQELEPGKQKMLTDRTSTASSTHSINSERDNLPTSNRGLYGAQSAFLNKRSASDLNHAVRRLNLVPPRIVHRPNVKSGGRPPQATPSTPLNSRVPASTPTIQPNTTNRLQKSQSITNNTANAKAISQPSSRSNSPNRNRHPVPHPTVSRTNFASGAASKKLANGSGTGITNTPLKANSTQSASHRELAQGITKALKNVDIQSRSIRPNVIRSDDPRAYANSPNAHYTPRLSDSPQDFYGLTRKQEAALIRINNAEGNGNELGANRRRKSSSTQQVKQELPNEEYENSNNKWSYLSAEELSDDPDKQDAFIQQICDILSDQEAAEKEVEGALQILTRMIREGGITRWDAYFNNIFFAIQQVISHPLNDSLATRIGALKAMKELCMSQPKRLVTKTELLLMNILNAHENDDATVVRAAEDCGAALASRLPTNTCMNLLLTVIDDENSKYHQLSGAIKMLSNVIAKLPPDEVEKSLHAVAERMTRCYENSQSMVRRAAIICLVSISNAIGLENLKPHLNQSTLKLVEVYAARMTKKDNSS